MEGPFHTAPRGEALRGWVHELIEVGGARKVRVELPGDSLGADGQPETAAATMLVAAAAR